MGGCASHAPDRVVKSGRKAVNTKNDNENLLTDKGEVFYISHRELEKIKGNVVGGKERVEIFLSLKNVTGINPNDLSFELSISSVANKDLFNNLGFAGKINSETLIYPTTFIVDYVFECHQYINADILYQGRKIDILKTTLGRIFGAKGHTVEFPLNIDNNEVILVASVHAVAPEVESMSITFKLSADFGQDKFGNYSVVVSNTNFNGKLQKIYKTEEVFAKGHTVTTNPLILNDICGGNENQPIQFDFYDGGQGPIDSFKATLNDIRKGPIALGKGRCTITFDIQKTMQFVDYIEAGLQISVLCGLDYTGSNGDPNDKRSLHYIYGLEPNNYEQAISSCCSIVAYYDYDQLFPVFGFGANLPGQSTVLHCFNTNLTDNPNCHGVEGILNAYKHALKHVTLSGPTHFSPLIKGMTNAIMGANNGSSVYYVLMILTDGSIHDMAETKEAIYEASFLPLSIIIVGVGEADFGLMEELDGDKIKLTNSKGQPVNRDIVQFVKYNTFKLNITKLASEVLAEVPKQVQQYYSFNKNFKPYSH
jgi:hypothetical protein